MMEFVIIGLLALAILLIIISFSKKDNINLLENQVEQLSINLLQETYQLKKRMKVLEEELLLQDEEIHKAISAKYTSQDNSPQLAANEERNKIFSLYKKGFSYEEIAVELDAPLGTVKAQLHRARELMFEMVKNKRDHI